MGAETHILAHDDSVPREMARAAWRAWLRPRDFGVLTWLLWGGTVLTIIVLLLPTSSRWWASRAFAVATLVQPLFAIGALMAWLQSGRGWARVEDLALVPRAGGLWVLANVRALGLVLAIQALTLGVAVAWILRDSMLTNDADTFYAFIVFIGGFVVSGGCDPTLMLRPLLGSGTPLKRFARALFETLPLHVFPVCLLTITVLRKLGLNLFDVYWASIGIGLICAMVFRSAGSYRALPRVIESRVGDIAESPRD